MGPEQDRVYIRYGMARFGAYANVLPVLAKEVEQKFTDRRDAHYDPPGHEWANEPGVYLKRLLIFGESVTAHIPQDTVVSINPGSSALLADWPFPRADGMMRQARGGGSATRPSSLCAAARLR